MEVTKHQIGDALEIRVKGRLDGYWADHLARSLEQSVRDGAHRIRLNLADVAYMSSAGIGVIVKFYKDLKEIQGTLVVSSASPPVKKVLEMANLGTLLAGGEAPAEPTIQPVKLIKQLDRDAPTFEVRDLDAGAKLRCRVVGDPDLLRGCHYSEEHSRKIGFPDSTFAVGLGAFGNTFEDCSGRFGEFLAVAGAAAYQPTDGTNVPDYLLASGEWGPELVVLYSIVCEGGFSHLARFEPKKESSAAGLADVVATCLEIAGADAAGVVMVAESAGLMGAALRQSPARQSAGQAPFRYPQVREWLSFSAERAYVRSLAVVVGVVARGASSTLDPMLRPLAKASPLRGHFHAAAFHYRPFKKGRVDLKPTIATLFEAGGLQGVLHLLGDDREAAGAAQSEFVRGACWVAPIADIAAEKK